jgi:uncharacterized protein (TIGR03084 family)
MTSTLDGLLVDLCDEYARLDSILTSLSITEWESQSLAPGWSIADVVAHLALSEAGVASTLQRPSVDWVSREHSLDSEMDAAVQQRSTDPMVVFGQWRDACAASLSALRTADPTRTYQWAAAPLRPRTLATTRLAEHWAHGLDITEPLGISFPDTNRLRHIAWLGHATLPYAFTLHGFEPVAVRCELIGPDGERWTFGDADAEAVIAGSASEFCRVGAQRLAPLTSGLTANGESAVRALRVLRNYAV